MTAHALGSVADPKAASGTVDATAIALLKAILDGLAGIGGGTEYTEGDTDATITGPAILWEDAAHTLRAVSAAKPLPVVAAPPSAIVHGQKTVAVAGTEEALGASTTLYSGVRVKALHGNTGWVYVGANPVTSATGFVLDAGEEVFLEVANLATVYVDVSVNGEGVSYIGG